MRRIVHIIGAAGVAGIGMARCLKDHYHVQGHDSSPWGAEMLAALPEYEKEYENADMIIPVPDAAVLAKADHPKTFLPSEEEIVFCQDKARVAEDMLDWMPTLYWVRDTHGAGGSGAQMASEYLPGRNYSVELLYRYGKRLGYFVKERLAYDLKGGKEPTHQRGSSVVSRCIENKEVLELAENGAWRVADRFNRKPSGVYSVDLKEDRLGVPKITEINPGRFLTASYVYYYTTGYNLPLLMVKAYFGEKLPKLPPYPEGVWVVRQTDSLPLVFNKDGTKYEMARTLR